MVFNERNRHIFKLFISHITSYKTKKLSSIWNIMKTLYIQRQKQHKGRTTRTKTIYCENISISCPIKYICLVLLSSKTSYGNRES